MKIFILWLCVLPALVGCFSDGGDGSTTPEPAPTDVRSDFSARSSTYEMTGAISAVDTADTMSSGVYIHEHE